MKRRNILRVNYKNLQFIYNIHTFVAMKKNIEIHLVDLSTTLPLPYADEGIRAGFPSPAQDYMEQQAWALRQVSRTGTGNRLEAEAGAAIQALHDRSWRDY